MQRTVRLKTTHTQKWIYTQWNGPSETKPNPGNCWLCSYVCALHCAQLLHTILHRTDPIIFPLALQTITTAPMMSIWGKGELSLTTIGHVPGQPHFPLKTAPSHVVHGSFGPRVHHSNGISNASAVSAQLTAVIPYNLQWATISPSKLLLHIGIWTTNTRFPGPTQVNIPNGITVSALLLQGSTVMTDRPTSHTTPSVATGHI